MNTFHTRPDPAPPRDLRSLPPRHNELVLLRPWTADDLPVIAEASVDPYIPLITTIPAHYTPDQGAAWLQRQTDQAATRKGCPLAIVATTTDEVVGLATINTIDWTHRRGNIGYWILDRHRGLGYAKAAVTLLIEIGTELGLIRLQALIEPDNTASQTVCNTCGFTREGILRHYHRIGHTNRDMIMFARILPTDPNDSTAVSGSASEQTHSDSSNI
ncbi:GNAT family N-acetyltransferase [Nocardia sp. NPDC050630]|uniref:GNAT family N-acetyltransferase n=1 Tax=Nocardia sp. NPDC050630 TaxID=3364321 RepID=UPI0037A590A9